MLNHRQFCSCLAIGILALWAGQSIAQQKYMPPKSNLGPQAQPTRPTVYSLDDLINLSLTRNPSLQQAGLSIQAAQGKAYQSGLYPNPTVSFSADELGDRTGPGGILSPQSNLGEPS